MGDYLTEVWNYWNQDLRFSWKVRIRQHWFGSCSSDSLFLFGVCLASPFFNTRLLGVIKKLILSCWPHPFSSVNLQSFLCWISDFANTALSLLHFGFGWRVWKAVNGWLAGWLACLWSSLLVICIGIGIQPIPMPNYSTASNWSPCMMLSVLCLLGHAIFILFHLLLF